MWAMNMRDIQIGENSPRELMHRVEVLETSMRIQPDISLAFCLTLALCGISTLAGCSAGNAPDDNMHNPPTFDYCESTPPDDACYASKRDPHSSQIELARAIADKQMDNHPAETLDWDWGEATLMLGLIELYRVTGTTTYRDYFRDWIDYHLQEGYEIHTSDKCPPALAALQLYTESNDTKYRAVVEEVLDYLHNRALRTQEGGISHLGTIELFGPTLWLDSLFMFGNVLTRWGESQNDLSSLEFFREQFIIFSDALQ